MKAALRKAGLASLKAVPIEKTERVATDDEASFDLITGQSVYTARLALILPELLSPLDAASPGPHGVLACVPACRQLAVHLIRDSSVLASLQLMARFAINLYDSGAGPLSPKVFRQPASRAGVTAEQAPRNGPTRTVGRMVTMILWDGDQ